MTNQTEIDLQSINGNQQSASKGIEHGALLIRFAESIAQRDETAIAESRSKLLESAGAAVVVDAAGVAANFQRMVRIADAIGIPVDDMTTELGQYVRQELDLDRFSSAQNSRTRPPATH